MAELNGPTREAVYPKLSEGQIARLVPLDVQRGLRAGDIVFDQGYKDRSFFVVLEDALEVVSPGAAGEVRITQHEAGEFTSEVEMH